MKLNFKAAFVGLTKDPLWKIKTGIGTVLCLISAMLTHYIQNNEQLASSPYTFVKVVCIILSLIIGIFVSGYYFRFLHNLLNKKDELLPCWKDSRDIFLSGFTAFCAVMVLFVPYLLLDGLIMFLQFLTKTIPYGFTVFAALFLLIASIIVSLVFLFIYMPFLILMSVVFARDLKFSSFFKFKEGSELWKRHKFSFYGLLLLYLVLILIQACIFLISKYDMAVMVVLSIPNFYLSIVFYRLLAQWADRDTNSPLQNVE